MLRVQVSGYAKSGKTSELLRLAAEYTSRGHNVCFVNEEYDIRDLYERHRTLGGDPALFAIVREFVETPDGQRNDDFFDFVLSEQNLNRKAT